MGLLGLKQKQHAGFSTELPGAMAPATVNGAGVDILSPMNIARAHLDTRTVLRLDEPATRQRRHPPPPLDPGTVLRLEEPRTRQRSRPLRLRALVPLADPAHRQDREKDRRDLSGDLPHPHGRRLPADALHLEPAERAARQAAGAARLGPYAVVKHLRSV